MFHVNKYDIIYFQENLQNICKKTFLVFEITGINKFHREKCSTRFLVCRLQHVSNDQLSNFYDIISDHDFADCNQTSYTNKL